MEVSPPHEYFRSGEEISDEPQLLGTPEGLFPDLIRPLK